MLNLMARMAFALLLPLMLAGCFSEPETGPVEIKFDRDACHVCRMLISDRHYAAQIRGGPKHKAYKFDDLGELIIWLEKQPWKNDEKIEIWVMDMDTGTKWLDATKIRYMPGVRSPMDYGFGAIEGERKKSISFKEMVEKVKLRGDTFHCLPGTTIPAPS